MSTSIVVQKLANLYCDALIERDNYEENTDKYLKFDTMMEEVDELLDIFIEKIEPSFPPEGCFDDFSLSLSPGHYEYHGDEIVLDIILDGYTYYVNYYFSPIEVVFYNFKAQIQEIENESTDNESDVSEGD